MNKATCTFSDRPHQAWRVGMELDRDDEGLVRGGATHRAGRPPRTVLVRRHAANRIWKPLSAIQNCRSAGVGKEHVDHVALDPTEERGTGQRHMRVRRPPEDD